jgi:hypothetical protein
MATSSVSAYCQRLVLPTIAGVQHIGTFATEVAAIEVRTLRALVRFYPFRCFRQHSFLSSAGSRPSHLCRLGRRWVSQHAAAAAG